MPLVRSARSIGGRHIPNADVERFLTSVLSAQVRRLTDLLLQTMYVPAPRRVLRPRLADVAAPYDRGSAPVTYRSRRSTLPGQ